MTWAITLSSCKALPARILLNLFSMVKAKLGDVLELAAEFAETGVGEPLHDPLLQLPNRFDYLVCPYRLVHDASILPLPVDLPLQVKENR